MKTKFFSMLLCAAALFAVGCQKDGTETEAPKEDATVGTVAGYAKIKIAMPGGTSTRAEQFEEGTNGENDVKNYLIVFYDKDGNVLSSHADAVSKDPTLDDAESGFGWSESKVVPLNMIQAGTPVYALAFLNYNPAWNLTTTTMNAALALTEEVYTVTLDGASYFVMTNSGRFDEGTYNVATKVEGYIYPTKEAAESSNSITIYVERVAARVNLNVDTTGIVPVEAYNNGNKYNLTFDVLSWGVTATEKSTYLMKNSSNLTAYATGYPTGFAEWIDFQKHRTFWATSVAYTGATYPAIGTNGSGVTLTLNYVSFDDLKKTDDLAANNKLTENETTTTTLEGQDYIMEHTFDAATLKNESTNEYAVPTSVVIYGAYTATPAEGTTTQAPDLSNGFYVRRIGTSASSMINFYVDDELKNELTSIQTVIATEDDGKMQPVKDASSFVVKNTFTDTEAARSNTFTLQLENAGTDLFYYTGTTWEAITAENLVDANKALQKNVGTAAFYNGGHAYFYVPVLHYTNEENYPNPNGYTGDFAYDTTNDTKDIKNLTGEFGIVRNHIYKINVNQIVGLGYGESGDGITFPLPDPDDTKEYYFYATMEVLSWHVVEHDLNL